MKATMFKIWSTVVGLLLCFNQLLLVDSFKVDFFQEEVLTFEKDWTKLESAVSTHFHNDEPSTTYDIADVDGLGRMFDGIGGLSGGGATSRLLVNYKEPFKSQILDYLFKPNFGASLHILKVEIGGDAQSTEGTEHSHMHNATDENYNRGYEWWLMKEAKLRNPDIKLVALPWGWPGWIGQGTSSPYANISITAYYVMKWIQGAKLHHDLTIDYVGIWNELQYNVDYIKLLRKNLDTSGYSHVKIIAADGSFAGISEAILKDSALADAVSVIGAHYPGTVSTKDAVTTGKQLWASEDYSTYNNDIGAGCWARILNQNYVNGNMTATISWNLIASYYDDLPFKRCSLMTANQPWSGHYEVPSILWITAHTTQFTEPGWRYLPTVGHLQHGGSYVSLTDGVGNLTIVIETMSHDQSVCIRPRLANYTVQDQYVTFKLGGSFQGRIDQLRYWQTQLGPSSTSDQVFVDKGSITVNEDQFTLLLPVDAVVTISTISTAKKGSFPAPPASASFPIPYNENFEPNGFSEAFDFSDQSGAFENFYNSSSTDGHQTTLRQVVTQRPITWCDDPNLGITVMGDYTWSAVNVTVAAKAEGTEGVFLALRVDKGGCDTREARGIFLWLKPSGLWMISSDLNRANILKRCYVYEKCWNTSFRPRDWNTLSLAVGKEGKIYAYINGCLVWGRTIKDTDGIPGNGWVALGTMDFGLAQFDDFSVKSLA